MIKFQADLDETPYCCGFLQAGHFTEEESGYPEFYAKSAEGLIHDLLRVANGKPVMFNFVTKPDYNGVFAKKYDAHKLRAAVKIHPNVQHIGTHINPASNNRIDSYIIFGYTQDE